MSKLRKSKKIKFKPSEGELVADGVPTTVLGPGGTRETVYLSPRKVKPIPAHLDSDLVPLPSLLSTLSPPDVKSSTTSPSALQDNETSQSKQRKPTVTDVRAFVYCTHAFKFTTYCI